MSSAVVNVVQLTVKMVGFAVALPLTLRAVGGFGGLHARIQDPAMWNAWSNGPSGWVYLAMLMPAFIVSPGLLQKIYGARDDRSVRIGVGLNAAALLAFALVPPLLGLSALALHPGLSNRELALPTLLIHDVPFWVGGLGLAAVFSAEVSAGRRDSVHARDVTLSGSLQALLQAVRDRQAGAHGRAGRVGRWRRARRGIGDRVRIHHRCAQHLLHAAECQPVRAHRRRAVHAPSGPAGRPRRHRWRGDGGDCRAAVERRPRDRRVHAGHVRSGRGRGGVCARGRDRATLGLHVAGAGRRIAIAPTRRQERCMTASRNAFDLTGRTAAVVGGGSGIGEAVTIGCARHGANVVCLDVNMAAAMRVAQRVVEDGGVCEAEALDITDGQAVERALDGIASRHGLDIAVCTPSINVRKAILRYTDEELSRVLDVNIKGNFNVLRAAGRIMTAQRKGSIILFSSIRSQVVEPGQSVYAATKAGDHSAREDRGGGVRSI